MADIPLEELKRKLGQVRAGQSEMSLADSRAATEASAARVRLPAGVTVIPVEVAGRPAEWVKPEGARTGYAILYLHGGGFVAGSCISHRPVAALFAAKCNVDALVIGYRLAPEHPWPAAELDSLAAYRHLLDAGFAPGRIAIIGDSAGGNLVTTTVLRAKAAGLSLPAACVLLSPWIDLEVRGENADALECVDILVRRDSLLAQAAQYLQGAQGTNLLAADLKGLPPVLIQVGGDEILLDDSTRLNAVLSSAGGRATLEVWPGLFHVWHAYAPWLKDGRDAIARVAAYLNEHW